MATCRDVAATGVVALVGELPAETVADLAAHVRGCVECSAYLGQLSSTAGIVAMRHNAHDDSVRRTSAHGGTPVDETPEEVDAGELDRRTNRLLVALAAAADPEHADDLVQDTWQHLLEKSPAGAVPTREELSEHLLGHIRSHGQDHEVDHEAWTDAVLGQGQAGQPSGDTSTGGLRDSEAVTVDLNERISARPLEHLDSDAERAELFYPDFYDDGPQADSWVSSPSRWPTIAHILGPDAELETTELYREVDAALDDLPDDVWDAVHLIDLEGHTLENASWLLGVEREVALANLSVGRNHLRGRIDAYLTGGGS